MSSTFLQLFLLFDAFVIGAVAAVATWHAYAHFRPHKAEPEKLHTQPQGAHLPPAVRDHLLEAAQTNFQTVLDRSAAELQHDLGTTAAQLNKLLEKIGTDIVGTEMERYHTEIDKLRAKAEAAIGGAQTEVAAHQAEIKAKLDEQMMVERQRLVDGLAAEKQQLTQQIDTKLADAVASFLLETLQHNVDLGAQSTYLTAMLEEHKADFTREVAE